MRRRDEKERALARSVQQHAMLSALCEVQDRKCGICSQNMDPLKTAKDQNNPRRPTLEHVFPTGFGGVDAPGNLFATHGKCNNDKGSRPPTEAEVALLEHINKVMGYPNFHLRSKAA